jgi:hypothetical protein
MLRSALGMDDGLLVRSSDSGKTGRKSRCGKLTSDRGASGWIMGIWKFVRQTSASQPPKFSAVASAARQNLLPISDDIRRQKDRSPTGTASPISMFRRARLDRQRGFLGSSSNRAHRMCRLGSRILPACASQNCNGNLGLFTNSFARKFDSA